MALVVVVLLARRFVEVASSAEVLRQALASLPFGSLTRRCEVKAPWESSGGSPLSPEQRKHVVARFGYTCRPNYSIQVNCICIAPNHNKPYLKALYIEGQDLKMFFRETQQFHNEQALWQLWREKTPSVTGRNLEQNQTQCASTCWGEQGKMGRKGEMDGEEGER